MADMTKDILAEQIYGKIAIQKLSPVSENFRLYEAGWLDSERTIMKVTGADFREAKRGKNKGRLSVMLKDTKRSVYVTSEEIIKYDTFKKLT